MKTIAQVLGQALLSLEEKYHQRETITRAGADAQTSPRNPAVPPISQTEAQREVLQRFMHLRGWELGD